MSQVVFAAKKRTGAGSGDAKRIRRSGRIPAVIYGHSGEALTVDLDALDFTNSVRSVSESTIVQVNVDGQIHNAFVKDTQRNITDGKILHVDFYEVQADTLVRARVPLHISGNPAGVREGGVFETSLHDIEVECFPKDLPERINVDVSELGVNQSIHVRDLPLGEGVRLLSGKDQVVALVKFARVEEVAAPAAEAVAAVVPEAAEAKE
jgi:large subunit ribosomal protein L25